MKGIVLKELGGPEKLCYDDLPDPVPQEIEVLVRLKSAALNHRDLWIRKGLYADIQLPTILGSDGSGEIIALGSSVKSLDVGQPVILNPCFDWGHHTKVQGSKMKILGMPDNGTYAELVTIPASNALPKPETLTYEESAALSLAGMTAYRAVVTKAQIKANETMLVTGIGGGVAVFALQIAKVLGADLFVTSSSEKKIKTACNFGALGGVNYLESDWDQKLRHLLNGKSLDVIIDGTGGHILQKALALIAPGGKIVSYGATLGPTKELEIRRLFWKQVSILGSTMASPTELTAFLKLYTENNLKPPIDKSFTLEKASDAHLRMEQAHQFGKIILKIP